MPVQIGFMYSTNITSDGLSLSAFTLSSENSDWPKANLQDVYLGRPLKFGGLFRIITGNRDIKMTDTDTSTTSTIQLVAGNNYTTGAALATALQTLINAASGFSNYTVSYSTTTGKFTIANTDHNFDILWTSTGGNSVGETLGFDTSSNNTGAATYTGANIVVNTEEYIEVNLGAAGAPDGLFFVGTNLSASAVVKVFSSSSDLTGTISSGVTYQSHFTTNGTLEKTLTANTDFGVDDFNDTGFVNLTLGSNVQYWYLSIIDPTPRSDRVEQEIGRFGLGTLTKPDRAWAQAYNANLLDPSPLSDTFGGLLTGQSFPQVRELVVNWIEVTSAIKDTIEAIYRDRPNPLITNGDISTGQQALYSQITNAPLSVRSSDPSRWNVGTVTFRQIPRRQV